MNNIKETAVRLYRNHKRTVIIWVVAIFSCGMIFKGLMQYPQIMRNRSEIASLEQKTDEERNRQAEIDDLSTKVNTDEYIERIASEKLGLVKSNAKIFIDVSDED